MQTRGNASSASGGLLYGRRRSEHPAYDQLPTDDRLLLCRCMNIDEKHPLRR